MPKGSPAKARAIRISLSSHAHDSLANLRNVLVLVGLGACIIWLFASFFLTRADHQYSPGPVSKVHAHLGCAACHDATAPLRDDTFLASWKTSSASQDTVWHRSTDLLCQTCHPVTGQTSVATGTASKNSEAAIAQVIPVCVHSVHQKPETVGSCASCHAEHRGAGVLPSQVADQACADCHVRLAAARIGEGDKIQDGISRFALGVHPEFTSLQQDRGTLKFSHTLHMSPGLFRADDNPELARTWNDYPLRSDRMAQYVDAEGLIRLDCQFCHSPTDDVAAVRDIAWLGDGTRPVSGKFMSLPNYEQHCQVCHAIDLVPPVNFNFASELKISHGSGREKLANDLKIYFALQAAAPQDLPSLWASSLDIPSGEAPTPLWNADELEPELSDQFHEFFSYATTALQSACLHCHLVNETDGSAGLPTVQLMPAVSKSRKTSAVYPEQWLKRGRFDHAAHRDTSCATCHAMNDGKTSLIGTANLMSDQPMIAGLESCLRCHQHPQHVVAPARAGPTNCISCHDYHQVASP